MCEALAQVAVAVVVLVCVDVVVVVEVVLKSNFCAGCCFPSVQYAGGEVGWYQDSGLEERDPPTELASDQLLQPLALSGDGSTTRCPTTTR